MVPLRSPGAGDLNPPFTARRFVATPDSVWTMREHVSAVDLGVTWSPGTPEATLLIEDLGKTVLALRAHHDDADQGCVVLVWTGTQSAQMGGVNDEAISGHHLAARGLRDVLWAGTVRNSRLIRSLERQNSVHPYHDRSRFQGLTHYVLPLKEGVVEVVAERVEVLRITGSTLQAAAEAARP